MAEYIFDNIYSANFINVIGICQLRRADKTQARGDKAGWRAAAPVAGRVPVSITAPAGPCLCDGIGIQEQGQGGQHRWYCVSSTAVYRSFHQKTLT